MLKLLRANFYRLWRSQALWLCAAGAFVLSAAFLLGVHAGEDGSATLDNMFLQVFPFLAILHAAFTSLFLGAEYQDGTLRNKLIAGHPRWEVYGAYLITAAAGCFVIMAGWLAGCAVGAMRFGWFTMPAQTMLLVLAVALLLTAALTAIFTLVGLLLPNRAAAAVVSIVLAFLLILAGSSFYNALNEPELTQSAVMTVNGFEYGDLIPNPYYISGIRRAVYRFAVDALPTGQAIQLANRELTRPALSMAASAGLVLLCAAAGMAAFRRKDLK